MATKTPKIFKVLSVATVRGGTLYQYWSRPMQVIKTDAGEFVDNMPGVSHGYWRGHSWENEIGKTVLVNKQKSRGHWLVEFKSVIKEDEVA